MAHEVKELARQTADATADIGQRIQAIQSTTGASVESMNRIVEVIKTINEASRTIAAAVEEQSVTTRKISESISTVVQASEEVSRGVSESATTSRQIAESITKVDASVKQTTEGAGQSKAASQEMASQAGQLQTLVGQFRV